MKRILALWMAVIIAVATPVSVLADVKILDESNFDSEWEILTSTGGELTSGKYTLDQDTTLTTDITIPNGAEVTIDLNGFVLKGTGTDSAVTNYGTFTLEDSSENNSGTLTGPTNLEYDVECGGGVYNDGTFTMKGGEISGMTSEFGGGVYNYGTFTMDGGEISGNESSMEGGGVYNFYGTFTMNGGEISGNSSDSYDGGVENKYGTFTMNNGKISGNVSSYGGGGVGIFWGTFTMNGGEISDNESSMEGGGVRTDGTFTMNGGEISDNSSDYGGGVHNNSSGTFTMTGGEISGNKSYSYGGGVYNGEGGTFTMKDGEISGNKSSGSGGGVYNEEGTFTMDGGEISGNSSDSYGGGVYKSAGDSLYVSGDAVVSGNTGADVSDNIYLDLSQTTDYPTRSYIQLTGPLTEGACIGVTTSKKLSVGSPVQITSAETNTKYYAKSAQYFFSDEGYSVSANEDGHYVEMERFVTGISDCSIKLGKTNYTYDGSAKEPSVTIEKDSAMLVEGTDYTVSYSNNINAGTATVTITGIGNYSGTATKSFTINKADQTVTGKASASSIEVGKTATITASGTGTISYSSSDTSVATVSSKGVVTGKSVGTVIITVNASGDSNYNSGSTTVEITITVSSTNTSSSGSSKSTETSVIPATPTKILRVKGTAKSTSITLTWNMVRNADGYVIYGAPCGKEMKKLKTIRSGSTLTWKNTKLKKGTSYKYVVKAYKTVGSTKVVLKSSNGIHMATTNGKYTNVRKVKLDDSVRTMTMESGATETISSDKISVTLNNNKKFVKKHADFIKFRSNNKKVAQVNATTGEITAKKAGSCLIYVYAGDGQYAKVHLTVE